MKRHLSNLASALLVGCALLVTGLVARRELFAGRSTPPPAVRLVGWERLAEAGHRFGPAGSRVTIVEFSDFQCPFCGRVQPELKRVLREHAGQVAVVFRHFPLTAIHPHARAAAAAAECAGEQGRFEAYHDALFARQDSIGRTPWAEFARSAGVPDLEAFGRCVASGRTAAAVDADVRQAEQLGLDGTPTFVINGRLVGGAPNAESWDRLIREALAGPPAQPPAAPAS